MATACLIVSIVINKIIIYCYFLKVIIIIIIITVMKLFFNAFASLCLNVTKVGFCPINRGIIITLNVALSLVTCFMCLCYSSF